MGKKILDGVAQYEKRRHAMLQIGLNYSTFKGARKPGVAQLHRGQTENFDLSENFLPQNICSVELNAGAKFGALKPRLSGTFPSWQNRASAGSIEGRDIKFRSLGKLSAAN